ncbi:hypothetical protein JMA_40490 (plasmid) [Jeotgalibacillus malaysiensis]|uniref:Uncharacterized protein n=1 Tax=Jeotgalibacillus malaysiensis TaxID=1508404 RepID=A0A0B5AXG4_9BACL|nr:hypothetical protein [Jeotgalibacillus malaysiensis]AJD93367.1 hypothetical protein JMA_40490 [Jeotgalibacillus malaysiensis]
MKQFVHLKVYEEAYYSGAVVEDEIFLTPEIYEAIKDELGETLWVSGLDGKHSETDIDIQMQVVTEKDLEMFDFIESPTGELDDRISETLDELELSPNLREIHEEATSFIQKETLTFSIRKEDKDTILEFLHGMGYIL